MLGRPVVMPHEKLPRVGDRVNVVGREGVFFVVKFDGEARSVSLLPSDDRRILYDIPMDTLRTIPGPGSNGAARI